MRPAKAIRSLASEVVGVVITPRKGGGASPGLEPRGRTFGMLTSHYGEANFRHAFNMSNSVGPRPFLDRQALIAADGFDSGPVPRLFVALTRHV